MKLTSDELALIRSILEETIKEAVSNTRDYNYMHRLLNITEKVNALKDNIDTEYDDIPF